MSRRKAPDSRTTLGPVAGIWVAVFTGAAMLGSAAPAPAAFPGQNGAVAYDKDESNTSESDIFTVGPGGGGETPLTDAPGEDENPAFSADGQRIVFDSGRDAAGGREIYVMNADGSGETRLTTNAADDRQPAFSPDGQRIVFQRDDAIAVMDADGSDEELLTLGGAFEESPSFSPDGTKIVFTSCPPGDCHIATMNADGTGQTSLTSGGQQEINPNFSPDGSMIVFEHLTSSDRDVEVMSASGTGRQALTVDPDDNFDDETPVFSPDGSEIAFLGERCTSQSPCNARFALRKMPAGGGEAAPLTAPASTGGSAPKNPDWQPIPADTCPAAGARSHPSSTRSGDYAGPRPPSMARRHHARAGSPPAPRIDEVAPRRSIAGAAVTLKGRGLASDRLKANVDGKRARLFSARGSRVTLGLPTGLAPGRARIRLTRANHATTGLVRIVEGFDGAIGAELEEERATTQTVGPAGAALSATGTDGTRFELQIPAGALATESAITMTPVSRLKDSPLSGPAEGVDLAPDGLEFSSPATLSISRSRGFPPGSVGFAMGESLEIAQATGARDRLVLQLDHFSVHGAGGLTEQDAAEVIDGYLRATKGRNLTRSEVRSLLTVIGHFDRRYSPPPTSIIIDGQGFDRLPNEPSSFCARLPVCGKAEEKARSSIRALGQAACDRGKATPSIAPLTELNNVTAEFQLLGGEGKPFDDCAADIGRRLHAQIMAALQADPLARSSLPPLPRNLPPPDLNGDRLTSAFESAKLHATAFGLLAFPGFAESEAALLAELDRALIRILEDNRATCENPAASDDSAAASRLREGHAYAVDRGQLVDEYLAALEKCGVAVVISPQSVVLGFGDRQRFTATVTSLDATEQAGVVFSADSPGSITADGLYTAPDREGVFQVRATSTLNGNRFDTATVTVVPGC